LPLFVTPKFRFSVILAGGFTIFRFGLKADWPRVFADAAKRSKAVEVDCYPDRQDLSVRLLRVAKREGTLVSLGTDAHHPRQLEFIELGWAAALKAGLAAARIINFLSLSELLNWSGRDALRASQDMRKHVPPF
jgi:DNA polymerase (family 10)